jgi:peroxiredoxin
MAELSEFRLHPGDAAPEFALPDTEGKVHRLADFHEPLLLVVFWCNHCPYVQAWEGRMIDLARRYRSKGVGIVLINANDAQAYPTDGIEGMRARAKEKGYPFPYLRDESQEVAHAYGALVTPHPMLFDRERKLLFQGRIDDRHDQPAAVRHKFVEAALDQALAGKRVDPAQLPVQGCTVKWRP